MKGFSYAMKGGKSPRPRNRDQGQSIVEAAFILPALLLILAVVVDAARAFDAYIVLANAAREGARFGSLQLNPPPIEVKDLVVQDVLGSGTNVTHMGDFAGSNVELLESDDTMTVTVRYDFPLWFGGLVGIDTLRLTQLAAMPKNAKGSTGSP
jgi:Flp pilus assembly protein TadG